MQEQAIAAFVQEAQEILGDLEDKFLGLEVDRDQATVDAIFRGLHTLKGSGAMFGFTKLAEFAHHFENAFEMVRAGQLPIDKQLIDLSLNARDKLGSFIDLGGDTSEADALLGSDHTKALIAEIMALTGAVQSGESAAPTQTPNMVQAGPTQTFEIRFRPLEKALKNGMRPDLLVRELEQMGPADIKVDASSLPELANLDPVSGYLTWNISVKTDQGTEAVQDVFIFADDADLKISESREHTEAQTVTTEANEAPTTAAKPTSGPATRQENIRIASGKVDGMMDSIGELVIAQARLDAVSEGIANPMLNAVVEEVGRLVLGLRDATLAIRMLPIETVFGKFRRVVRDLSAELGKDVQLITSGGATEVDKTVIDKLGDPLVHMIRNSIDHGIENAETRLAAGKPAQGRLRLAARQEGGEVLISIEDNGGGLNSEGIRARAIKSGLIEEDSVLTDRELNALIFEPGFSTAETVSAVSGRGVGMDAVRSAIDGLGGNIDIFTVPGRGTRITLRLPVTMAIIDGLRVRLGNSVYVVPLGAVVECVEMDETEAQRASGRSVLQIREHVVPYLMLSDLFQIPSVTERRRRVVVVRVDGQRVGLVVDDILGQGQTVIKSLSPYHRDLPGLGGATILSDGRVALILDVGTLVRWAQSRLPNTMKVA